MPAHVRLISGGLALAKLSKLRKLKYDRQGGLNRLSLIFDLPGGAPVPQR